MSVTDVTDRPTDRPTHKNHYIYLVAFWFQVFEILILKFHFYRDHFFKASVWNLPLYLVIHNINFLFFDPLTNAELKKI